MGIERFIVKKMLRAWEESDNKILANQILPDGVTEITDVAYIDDGNYGHMLDIYYPQGVTGKLPVIINIHGGGFVYGDKKYNKAFGFHLAKRGFIVFNINYRLVLNDTKVPGQIQDVMSAINWISRNHPKYPANIERAYIVGDSAGGVLAVMAAMLSQRERMQGIFHVLPANMSFRALGIISGLMNFDKDDFKYRGLRSVCFDRGYKRQEYYECMIFRNTHEMRNLPPVFLITSEEDELRDMTLDFIRTLEKFNIKHELKDYSKGGNKRLGHIFCVQFPEYEESNVAIDNMVRFFHEN